MQKTGYVHKSQLCVGVLLLLMQLLGIKVYANDRALQYEQKLSKTIQENKKLIEADKLSTAFAVLRSLQYGEKLHTTLIRANPEFESRQQLDTLILKQISVLWDITLANQKKDIILSGEQFKALTQLVSEEHPLLMEAMPAKDNQMKLPALGNDYANDIIDLLFSYQLKGTEGYRKLLEHMIQSLKPEQEKVIHAFITAASKDDQIKSLLLEKGQHLFKKLPVKPSMVKDYLIAFPSAQTAYVDAIFSQITKASDPNSPEDRYLLYLVSTHSEPAIKWRDQILEYAIKEIEASSGPEMQLKELIASRPWMIHVMRKASLYEGRLNEEQQKTLRKLASEGVGSQVDMAIWLLISSTASKDIDATVKTLRAPIMKQWAKAGPQHQSPAQRAPDEFETFSDVMPSILLLAFTNNPELTANELTMINDRYQRDAPQRRKFYLRKPDRYTALEFTAMYSSLWRSADQPKTYLFKYNIYYLYCLHSLMNTPPTMQPYFKTLYAGRLGSSQAKIHQSPLSENAKRPRASRTLLYEAAENLLNPDYVELLKTVANQSPHNKRAWIPAMQTMAMYAEIYQPVLKVQQWFADWVMNMQETVESDGDTRLVADLATLMHVILNDKEKALEFIKKQLTFNANHWTYMDSWLLNYAPEHALTKQRFQHLKNLDYSGLSFANWFRDSKASGQFNSFPVTAFREAMAQDNTSAEAFTYLLLKNQKDLQSIREQMRSPQIFIESFIQASPLAREGRVNNFNQAPLAHIDRTILTYLALLDRMEWKARNLPWELEIEALRAMGFGPKK